jgi:hypothetical protein
MFVSHAGRFEPTAATLGPWHPGTLHGGPVCGLLAHGVLAHRADDEMQLARLTVDLPRPVPAVALELRTDVLRQGRRIAVVEACLAAGDTLVARGTGLLLRRSAEPPGALRQEEPTISPRADAVPADLPPEPLHHANCIDLWRAARGAYWVRMELSLVDDAPIDAAERAAVVADWANPAANFQPGGISFINPDMTLYLHRPPRGAWIGVGPALRASSAGIGVSDCPMTDDDGVAGRCLAAAFAAGVTTDAPGR